MNPEVHREGGCHICRLTGIIDGQSGVFLQTAVRTSLQQTGEGRLVLECSGVEHADAAGARMLMQISKMMAGKGGMVLAAVSPALRQCLEAEGCEHFLETAVSLPAAVRNAGAPSGTPAAASAKTPAAVPQPVPAAQAWPEPSPVPASGGGASSWNEPAARSPGSVPPPPPMPQAQEQPRPPVPAPSRMPDLAPPPSAGNWDNVWDQGQGRGSKGGKAKKAPKKPPGSGSSFPWKPALLAGLAALMAIGGFSLWVFLRSPQVQLSSETEDIKYGAVGDPVIIEIKYGKLSLQSRKQLEKSLTVDNPENTPDPEDSSLTVYKVTGAFKPQTKTRFEFPIIGERNGRESRKTLTFNVEGPEFEFVKSKVTLLEGVPISVEKDGSDNYLLAQNAAGLIMENENEWPPGLKIESRMEANGPGTSFWIVTGTPEKAGQFKVGLEAKVAGGSSRKKRIDIIVKEAPGKPAKETASPVNGPPAASTAAADATEKSQAGADPPEPAGPDESAMRQAEKAGVILSPELTNFLMARIRESHFDPAKKELMRSAVDGMQVGLHLCTIPFGRGTAALSSGQREILERSIAEQGDFFDQYKEKNLEFMIVGYASMPGTPSQNMELSWSRAKAAEDLLKGTAVSEKEGRAGGRISLTVGYGATSVIGKGTPEENQVAEIFVGIPPMDSNLREMLSDLRGYIGRLYGRR